MTEKNKKNLLISLIIFVVILIIIVLFKMDILSINKMSDTKDEVLLSQSFFMGDSVNDENTKISKKIEKKYPYIKFVQEKPIANSDYVEDAAIISGQQPFISLVPFTDAKKYAVWGRAADITKQIKKYKYNEMLNPKYLNLSTVDGKYYGLPRWVYHIGMIYNKKLFNDAGLIDNDEYPIYPDNYEELLQTAIKIKENTGKAGFFFPNTQGQGGWAFMNIGWSYGVEFIKEENGRMTSGFNTPECVAALQYVKDLKWKYDVLPRETFGDSIDFIDMFSKNEVAMGFCSSSEVNSYIENMPDKFNSVALSKIPAGPKGRFSLCGGTFVVFSPEATQDQLDAAFLWFDEYSFNDHIDKKARKIMDKRIRDSANVGQLVGYVDESVFDGRRYYNMRKEINEKYSNIDYNAVKNFSDDDDVIYRLEYENYPQELYKILDVIIQTVMTDKSADCASLVASASEKFNVEYLDKVVY